VYAQVAHSTYLCLALLSFLLDEVENGVRFCLLLLAKVDSLEQIRLFSLCFPKWPTAHHFFIDPADERTPLHESSATKERSLLLPEDINVSLRLFSAFSELLGMLVDVSPGGASFIFDSESEGKKLSSIIKARQHRPPREAKDQERTALLRATEELANSVCDERIVQWHELSHRKMTLEKRATKLETIRRSKQTTMKAMAASMPSRTPEEVEEEQLREELASAQAALQQLEHQLTKVEKPSVEDENESRECTALLRQLILPHPECGATLLFVLCDKLGFLHVAQRVHEWMGQVLAHHVQEETQSTSSLWRRRWLAPVDQYGLMLSATTRAAASLPLEQ